MGGMLYSSSHDRSKKPISSAKPKSRKSRQITSVPSPPPKSLEPTEEHRRQLRIMQLEAEGRIAAVPDPDLSDIPDVRREYEVDGEITHSEPRHRSPRFDIRRMHTLPDSDLISDDEEFVNTRLADVQDSDSSLFEVDQSLSDVFQAVKTLSEKLKALKFDALDSKFHHLSEINQIIDGAVMPWLEEIDDHFDDLSKEDLPDNEESSIP